MNTERRRRNQRSAAVSAEDQPQRSRIPASTRWNQRCPVRPTGCGWCSAHTAALRERSSRAARILPWPGRPARPATSSSLPIPLPKIPLPNSAVLPSASVPHRQPNHACLSAPAAGAPGAGRWQFSPHHSLVTRCARGPVAHPLRLRPCRSVFIVSLWSTCFGSAESLQPGWRTRVSHPCPSVSIRG